MSGPIRAADLPITLWKNQAGRKADVASGPGWTIGYAWLDGDAAFSDYGGHDRTITLVSGAGFTLSTASGEVVVHAEALHRPASFDGGARVVCRVLGGPCRVLNVMTERALRRHRVEILDAGATATPANGEVAVLVALGGPLTVSTGGDTHILSEFDALPLHHAAIVAPGEGCRAALLRILAA